MYLGVGDQDASYPIVTMSLPSLTPTDQWNETYEFTLTIDDQDMANLIDVSSDIEEALETGCIKMFNETGPVQRHPGYYTQTKFYRYLCME